MREKELNSAADSRAFNESLTKHNRRNQKGRPVPNRNKRIGSVPSKYSHQLRRLLSNSATRSTESGNQKGAANSCENDMPKRYATRNAISNTTKRPRCRPMSDLILRVALKNLCMFTPHYIAVEDR